MVRVYRRILNVSYESDFDQQMMEQLSQSDVVWDIGANVGHFTTKFAEKVGRTGRVFAFEPAVSSYSTLVRNCASLANVSCLNLALSDRTGSLNFRDSGLENDPTNGLVDDDFPGAIKVPVASGDTLIQDKSIPPPNVIKIDVEGYEYDVIGGLRNCLRASTTKKVFVEVHFLEMNKRGLKDGAVEIVKQLTDSGFSVRWTDPSHFIASRH